jgi:bifunctional UDP-N-acetylglucosamine pyrophosphorylase/glucosamine-1-phosphate N-acetyltransferase
MQAIILAAGKGTRLGSITEETPKPMILINGRPLLAYILERLPDEIDNVLIAVGHQSDKIKAYFKNSYAGKSIVYVDASDLSGTAGALFQARISLKGRFLVLYADDVYERRDLENLIRYSYAMGIFEGKPNHASYLQVEMDGDGYITGFRKPTEQEITEGMRVVVGAFMLDDRIFDYEPVRIANGEYGLPQTILVFAKDHPVNAVLMPSWRTITYKHDIPVLESTLDY